MLRFLRVGTTQIRRATEEDVYHILPLENLNSALGARYAFSRTRGIVIGGTTTVTSGETRFSATKVLIDPLFASDFE